MEAQTQAEVAFWVDQYAAASDQLQANAGAAGVLALRQVDDWYGDAAAAAATAAGVAASNAATEAGAGLASQYIATVVAALRGLRAQLGRIEVAPIRKGVNLFEVYTRPVQTYRREVSLGATDREAAERAYDRITRLLAADVTLAEREAARRQMAVLGVTRFRRVIHPELSKSGTCGLCIAASDVVYKSAVLMPLHANCILGDAPVAAENVLAITRRNYSGPLVILEMASGEKLTITPNHPVLTGHGWVPASHVDQSDHLLHHRVGHGVAGRGPHEGDGPPTAEQVWRTATVDHGLDSRVVPLSAQDLHGDESDGEIHVIPTDRLLWRMGDVSFGQPPPKNLLVPRCDARFSLTGARRLLQSFLGLRDAAYGVVGSPGDGLTVGARGSRIAIGLSEGRAAHNDGSLLQSPVDHQTADAVLTCQSQDRRPGFVLPDYLADRQVFTDTTRFDPSSAKFTAKDAGAYGSLGRHLRERLSCDVEPDRVIEKRWVSGSHWVYNLHTAEGWYSANNYIVSNCNCKPMPIIGTDDPGRDINAGDLARIYRDAGSTGRADLKAVRYRVDEHGELGPVLTDRRHAFRAPDDLGANATERAIRELAQLLPVLESLERREASGEDVSGPLKYQRDRIALLRSAA